MKLIKELLTLRENDEDFDDEDPSELISQAVTDAIIPKVQEITGQKSLIWIKPEDFGGNDDHEFVISRIEKMFDGEMDLSQLHDDPDIQDELKQNYRDVLHVVEKIHSDSHDLDEEGDWEWDVYKIAKGSRETFITRLLFSDGYQSSLSEYLIDEKDLDIFDADGRDFD